MGLCRRSSMWLQQECMYSLKKKCPVHITRNVHLSQENCHRIHITFFSSRHIKSHYWSNVCDSCYINHTPLKGTWLGVHNKLDPMVFCDFLNIFFISKAEKKYDEADWEEDLEGSRSWERKKNMIKLYCI